MHQKPTEHLLCASGVLGLQQGAKGKLPGLQALASYWGGLGRETGEADKCVSVKGCPPAVTSALRQSEDMRMMWKVLRGGGI